MTRILGGDSHSNFLLIKDKNFLSPHICQIDHYIFPWVVDDCRDAAHVRHRQWLSSTPFHLINLVYNVQQWTVNENFVMTYSNFARDNEFVIVLTCVLNQVANCSSCNWKIWDSISYELLDSKYCRCCLQGCSKLYEFMILQYINSTFLTKFN